MTDHDLSAEARAEAAQRGEAMPDGSYPTRDRGELRKAFEAYGRETGDRAPLRRYLVRRAVRLGRPDLIPDSWRIRTRRG